MGKKRYRLSDSFFFNDTATTEIYTLSLHDALPIWQVKALLTMIVWTDRTSRSSPTDASARPVRAAANEIGRAHVWTPVTRPDLVCRLLLEKKKQAWL